MINRYRKLGRWIQYPFAYFLGCLIELDERIGNKTLYQSQIELNKTINKLIEEVYKVLKLKEICKKLERILSGFQRKRKCQK
jgi:ABC-type sugar transport system ATPase subunit